MRFSIITPSFRNSNWLKLCIASVADQQGADFEHIVQDSVSDDGTLDWLPRDRRVQAFVEKDRGMYDAVNRGLRRSRGEICAYLNCDEQYLPGTLAAVHGFFEQHPDIDVVFGDVVVVNPDGGFRCYRKVQMPWRLYCLVSMNLPIFTCATFFRRRIFDPGGLFFDEHLRDLGDMEWALRLIGRRIPMAVFRRFTTAFTETGENMNLKPNAQREKQDLFASAPLWARKLRHGFTAAHRLRRLWEGAYAQKPFEYAIYTQANTASRATFKVDRPTFRWSR